jgi:hypothetical protein
MAEDDDVGQGDVLACNPQKVGRQVYLISKRDVDDGATGQLP